MAILPKIQAAFFFFLAEIDKLIAKFIWKCKRPRINQNNLEKETGTSLVVWWLRIRLPMQGTQVRSLVWEDPTCHGATKPRHHNYWACEPQLLSPCTATTEARTPRACGPQGEAATMRSPRSATKSSPHWPQLEKAHAQQWRPNAVGLSEALSCARLSVLYTY